MQVEKALMILGAVLAVFVLGTCSAVYGYANGVRNEGIAQETQMSAQYPSNQNQLSTCISGFYEQMGVADRKSDKLDQVLSDAVKGRYEEGGLQVNSSIFTAIVEAYPKLDGLNVYDNIVNYIAACREGYRSTQDKLLDQVRRYKTWLKQDLFRQLVVETLGFPSDSLEARIGTNVVYGKEALKKMQQIVLVSDAKEAYETGEMEPLSPERKK